MNLILFFSFYSSSFAFLIFKMNENRLILMCVRKRVREPARSFNRFSMFCYCQRRVYIRLTIIYTYNGLTQLERINGLRVACIKIFLFSLQWFGKWKQIYSFCTLFSRASISILSTSFNFALRSFVFSFIFFLLQLLHLFMFASVEFRFYSNFLSFGPLAALILFCVVGFSRSPSVHLIQ